MSQAVKNVCLDMETWSQAGAGEQMVRERGNDEPMAAMRTAFLFPFLAGGGEGQTQSNCCSVCFLVFLLGGVTKKYNR